jgi:hypothetical protein
LLSEGAYGEYRVGVRDLVAVVAKAFPESEAITCGLYPQFTEPMAAATVIACTNRVAAAA